MTGQDVHDRLLAPGAAPTRLARLNFADTQHKGINGEDVTQHLHGCAGIKDQDNAAGGYSGAHQQKSRGVWLTWRQTETGSADPIDPAMNKREAATNNRRDGASEDVKEEIGHGRPNDKEREPKRHTA